MKNKKKKKSNAGLRNTIEEKIGRKILEKVNQPRDETSGPIMIPPIPDSKFIDKLPEGELEEQNIQEKVHQDSYEAEVRLYRSLEEMEGNFVVIHQLEFTHEQYSAFVGKHLCNRKLCKRGEEEHQCHKESKQIEGECDLVVLGDNFVAVFEVKGLQLQDTKNEPKLQGCCESALSQRKRIKMLIQSIEPSVMIYEFTIFPNIAMSSVPKFYLRDDSILFREDVEIIRSVINCCQELALFPTVTKSDGKKLRCCLLGLWCIDLEGHWNMEKCNLIWCIKDVDRKLKKALVTRKSVDSEKLKNSSKRGKNKAMKKKYPKNSEMVEAPKLFQDYLNISCLTQNQLDVFNSEERFLWIEGPAGAGKTVAMLGKIIDIVLNKPSKSRILIISLGEVFSPAINRHLQLLKRIATCSILRYIFFAKKKIPGFDLETTVRSLSEELKRTTTRIVLLALLDVYAYSDIYNIITDNFDYVFLDDHHLLTDLLLNKAPDAIEINWDKENIISQGLLPLVKSSNQNNTSLWVFYDTAQASYNNISTDLFYYPKFKVLADLLDHFKSLFPLKALLSVNLRNTMEISSVLSLIRRHRKLMESSGVVPSILPEQKLGHVLRGPKIVIYILRDNDYARAKGILERELLKFIESDYCLDKKDITVLPYADLDVLEDLCCSIMVRYGVRVMSQLDCMSAEWPAVICLYGIPDPPRVTLRLPDGSEKGTESGAITTNLYVALSRARVYSSVIFFNYTPNTNEDTDRLLFDLRQRRDICRIIDM